MKTLLEYELESYRDRVRVSISESTRAQAQAIDQTTDSLSNLLGGLHSIGTELNHIGADVARLVTMSASALPDIIELLARNADHLGGIEHMLATPVETAAAECYRAGSKALAMAQNQGSPPRTEKWYALAAIDLQRAVETYRYHPISWYQLGVVLDRQGSSEKAAEAFAQCAFFGVDKSHVLAATAVLLSAALYRQAGLSDKSAEVLRDYLPQLDLCAELHLALAVHHGDIAHLSQAFAIWPYLAADAKAAGVQDAESVAAALCERADGPVHRLCEMQAATEALVLVANAHGVTGIGAVPTVTLKPHGVEALLLASAASDLRK